MQIQIRQAGIFAALALLMAYTRVYGHLGNAVSLPDASWPVFFLAGFYLARRSWPAALAFAFLLVEAAGVDYYAIVYRGVSDECFSPAYWFLIPTYASLWYGGRWVATHLPQRSAFSLLAGVAWGSTTVAFLISNLSFYLLSDNFTKLSLAEYVARTTKYYPQFLACTLGYLACAAVLHMLFSGAEKNTAQSSGQA